MKNIMRQALQLLLRSARGSPLSMHSIYLFKEKEMNSLQQFQRVFFIGVAGTGMSALAQYLKGVGKSVSGSDRYFSEGQASDIRNRLEAAGIQCFAQTGEGITESTELVIVSTAVEDKVAEVQKAKQLKIPILRRSELLALITASKKTIAVGGTSGKSTTAAMLYDILRVAALDPSIISGAGLVQLIQQGKIGNASVGKGDWLVIEADESDGSIVQYHPEIGLLLNVDKDHQEIDRLMDIFTTFRNNSKTFIVNQAHHLARSLSLNPQWDFSTDPQYPAAWQATQFQQQGLRMKFTVSKQLFEMEAIGRHNMENALAAIAVAQWLGISLATCAEALKQYQGIYRRHQVLSKRNGVLLIDDYAHNPVKCAASIRACQLLAPRVIAWFQPHGYGPTRFLKQDFIDELSKALRPQDELWMSEIFYAGGTAEKNISSNEIITAIREKGKRAFFVENRKDFFPNVKPHLASYCVLLLMGARDPGLEQFAQEVRLDIQDLKLL